MPDTLHQRSEGTPSPESGYERGQRLYCPQCRSEIEVLNPSTSASPQLELRCCGEPMQPSIGVAVHLDSTA